MRAQPRRTNASVTTPSSGDLIPAPRCPRVLSPLSADGLTDSMAYAINETNRRRALQQAYNELNGITPQSVKSTVQALIRITDSMQQNKPDDMSNEELEQLMKSVEDQMLSAAKNLDFEKAAKLRDELFRLRGEGTGNIHKPQTHRRRRERVRK